MRLRYKLVLFLCCIGLVALGYYGSIVWTKHKVVANTAAVLEAIRADGEYSLIDYERVSADYDDGSVGIGHVQLIFLVEGEPLKVNSVFTIAPGSKPGQICALMPPDIDEVAMAVLTEWNAHMCDGNDVE